MDNLLARKNDHPIRSWQREMNKFFKKFNRDFDLSDDFQGWEEQFPKLEVKDTDKNYLIKAEVPGLTEKDISVSLKDNTLVIEGERKTETKKEDKGHYFSEFNYGSFYRSVPLSDEVDQENIKATYKNGILSVELPKTNTSSHSEKKIPVSLQ